MHFKYENRDVKKSTVISLKHFYVYLLYVCGTLKTFGRSECSNRACFISGDVYNYIVIVDLKADIKLVFFFCYEMNYNLTSNPGGELFYVCNELSHTV